MTERQRLEWRAQRLSEAIAMSQDGSSIYYMERRLDEVQRELKALYAKEKP